MGCGERASGLSNDKLPLHKHFSRKIRKIHLDLVVWRGRRARSRNVNTKYIAITGSATKSTTALLVGHILAGSSKGHVHAFRNALKSVARSLYQQHRDAEWAVKELGMRGQGSIAPMAKLVRPNCAIVTMVGLDHYQLHRSREAISQEKGALLEAVEPGGVAILNADDPHVYAMRNRTSERVITFGRSAGCDYRATDISASVANGLSLTLHTPKGDLPIRARFVAEHFWIPVVAAATCAIELGADPKMVASRIAGFRPHWDRCHPLAIPEGPTFIVDTYKAPLYSLELAFKPMENIQGRRRIVIGQLADYSGGSRQAARKARRLAEPYADELVFVGHSAKRLGLSEKELASGRYSIFDTVKEVTQYLKTTARPGETILLKSSGAIHLERAALDWTTHVRCWEERCGNTRTCIECARHGLGYSIDRGTLQASIQADRYRTEQAVLHKQMT